MPPLRRVLARVDDWEPATVAVAVCDASGTLATHGPVDAPLPWASITKPLYAYGVLTLVDARTLRLDEPAGPDGATVRHLLAHASGLPGLAGGPGGGVGARRIYSNEGFEVLGRHVAHRTGLAPAALLREAVLDPLDMDATELGDRSPAHGAVGPLRDLATFAVELLAPTLIGGDLFEQATTVQFPGLSGVLPGFGRQQDNAWGLGVEIRADKRPHWAGSATSPRTFGHFGGSGSFLWVDPELGVACCEVADLDFDAWPATERWPGFSDAVVQAVRGGSD